MELFQSTPSGGKATFDKFDGDVEADVSIHAFRGEGDYRPYANPE